LSTLLSHHIVRRSTDCAPAPAIQPGIGGLPQSFALGLVATSFLNASGGFGYIIARRRLLCTRYKSQLARYQPRGAAPA
jgi:hypothetical protein